MTGETQVLPPSEAEVRQEFPERRCAECGRPIHFDEVECPFCDNDVIDLG